MTTKAGTKANPHVGSDFDDFMTEEGLCDEAQAVAVKRVLAFQLERDMHKARLTKAAKARRMGRRARNSIGS